jgi:transcription initiation factor TFIIB
MVVEDDCIDHGPEWHVYEPDDRSRTRVGAPATKLICDNGLSTRIGHGNRDSNGNTLAQSKQYRMNRLRKWNQRYRLRGSRDRNLSQALGEIERMAAALGLPESTQETASVIYRRALEEELLPGRSIEGMATASLYAAARHERLPRTPEEFARVSRVERRRITRAFRYLSNQLGLATEPADAAQYLPRLSSDLELEEDTIQQARGLLDRAKERNIHSGKSPSGLAAAAVYAASQLTDEKVTQEALSESATVTKLTIRNRYPELLELEREP